MAHIRTALRHHLSATVVGRTHQERKEGKECVGYGRRGWGASGRPCGTCTAGGSTGRQCEGGGKTTPRSRTQRNAHRECAGQGHRRRGCVLRYVAWGVVWR